MRSEKQSENFVKALGFIKQGLVFDLHELIDQGLIEERDGSGNNLLHHLFNSNIPHFEFSGGSTDIISLFRNLDKTTGSALRQVNSDGDTPLHIMMRKSVDEADTNNILTNFLSSKYEYDIDFNQSNNDGNALWSLMILHNRLGIIAGFDNKDFKITADLRDGNKNSPLHLAARVGNLELCKQFYKIGNAKNKKGQSPLHMAAINGNLAIFQGVYNNIKRTITNPLTEKDAEGNTPFMLAAIHGNIDILKWALEEKKKHIKPEKQDIEKILKSLNDTLNNEEMSSKHLKALEVFNFIIDNFDRNKSLKEQYKQDLASHFLRNNQYDNFTKLGLSPQDIAANSYKILIAVLNRNQLGLDPRIIDFLLPSIDNQSENSSNVVNDRQLEALGILAKKKNNNGLFEKVMNRTSSSSWKGKEPELRDLISTAINNNDQSLLKIIVKNLSENRSFLENKNDLFQDQKFFETIRQNPDTTKLLLPIFPFEKKYNDYCTKIFLPLLFYRSNGKVGEILTDDFIEGLDADAKKSIFINSVIYGELGLAGRLLETHKVDVSCLTSYLSEIFRINLKYNSPRKLKRVIDFLTNHNIREDFDGKTLLQEASHCNAGAQIIKYLIEEKGFNGDTIKTKTKKALAPKLTATTHSPLVVNYQKNEDAFSLTKHIKFLSENQHLLIPSELLPDTLVRKTGEALLAKNIDGTHCGKTQELLSTIIASGAFYLDPTEPFLLHDKTVEVKFIKNQKYQGNLSVTIGSGGKKNRLATLAQSLNINVVRNDTPKPTSNDPLLIPELFFDSKGKSILSSQESYNYRRLANMVENFGMKLQKSNATGLNIVFEDKIMMGEVAKILGVNFDATTNSITLGNLNNLAMIKNGLNKLYLKLLSDYQQLVLDTKNVIETKAPWAEVQFTDGHFEIRDRVGNQANLDSFAEAVRQIGTVEDRKSGVKVCVLGNSTNLAKVYKVANNLPLMGEFSHSDRIKQIDRYVISRFNLKDFDSNQFVDCKEGRLLRFKNHDKENELGDLYAKVNSFGEVLYFMNTGNSENINLQQILLDKEDTNNQNVKNIIEYLAPLKGAQFEKDQNFAKKVDELSALSDLVHGASLKKEDVELEIGLSDQTKLVLEKNRNGLTLRLGVVEVKSLDQIIHNEDFIKNINQPDPIFNNLLCDANGHLHAQKTLENIVSDNSKFRLKEVLKTLDADIEILLEENNYCLSSNDKTLLEKINSKIKSFGISNKTEVKASQSNAGQYILRLSTKISNEFLAELEQITHDIELERTLSSDIKHNIRLDREDQHYKIYADEETLQKFRQSCISKNQKQIYTITFDNGEYHILASDKSFSEAETLLRNFAGELAKKQSLEEAQRTEALPLPEPLLVETVISSSAPQIIRPEQQPLPTKPTPEKKVVHELIPPSTSISKREDNYFRMTIKRDGDKAKDYGRLYKKRDEENEQDVVKRVIKDALKTLQSKYKNISVDDVKLFIKAMQHQLDIHKSAGVKGGEEGKEVGFQFWQKDIKKWIEDQQRSDSDQMIEKFGRISAQMQLSSETILNTRLGRVHLVKNNGTKVEKKMMRSYRQIMSLDPNDKELGWIGTEEKSRAR